MKRQSKKEIYASFGIAFDGEYITSPIGKIRPVLVDGNTKLGKGVWTWSMLPTNQPYNVTVNGISRTVSGTCPCHCKGCYATKGKYNCTSVIESLARKTVLAYDFLSWLERAIIAQIKADNIRLLRIHAAGDFFSAEYVAMWQRVVDACPDCVFWTYTKYEQAENAFDSYSNANCVKSLIHGYGFNFGHCDYILRVYKALKEAGKSVYICRCGIDKNQHCINCTGCSKNEIVLFVEHSTEYRAEKDPCFCELKAIIEAQPSQKA